MFILNLLIWFGIPIAMVVVGSKFFQNPNREVVGLVMMFIGIISLIIIPLAVLISQLNTMSTQAEAASIQETLDASRLNGQLIDKYPEGKYLAQHKELEAMSTMRDVISFNRALASAKFYNKIWLFDIFYNDIVNDVYYVR